MLPIDPNLLVFGIVAGATVMPLDQVFAKLGHPIVKLPIGLLNVESCNSWYFILSWMVYDARSNGTYSKFNSVYQIIGWFTTPHRIGFFFFIRVVNYTLMPFVNLFLVILVKKLIIGKFQ